MTQAFVISVTRKGVHFSQKKVFCTNYQENAEKSINVGIKQYGDYARKLSSVGLPWLQGMAKEYDLLPLLLQGIPITNVRDTKRQNSTPNTESQGTQY